MKLVVLANTLLGSVVQGQEAAHAVASFLLAGQNDAGTLQYITEWIADPERVTLIKKGGHHDDLAKIHACLISSKEIAGYHLETLKHSIHRDSRMNSLIMSIGILIPEDIWDTFERVLQGDLQPWDELDEWTRLIMNTIGRCPNAL